MDKKVKLTLVGLDGNAFVILGAFRQAARKQGFSKEWIEGVTREAMSGNYDHLLATIADNCEDVEEGEEEFEEEFEEEEG